MFLVSDIPVKQEQRDHGSTLGAVYHWRSEGHFSLQGVPIPAGYDEFSE